MNYSQYLFTRVNYTAFSPVVNHSLVVDPALSQADTAVVVDSLSSILAAVGKLKQATSRILFQFVGKAIYPSGRTAMSLYKVALKSDESEERSQTCLYYLLY